HRKVDACQIPAGNWKIPGRGSAAGQQDRIEVLTEVFDRHVHSNIRVRTERDAFLRHQSQPSVENLLLHLEFGNSVTKQSANSIGSLEPGDPVTSLIQLRCRGKARGSRAYDGDFLSGPHCRGRSPHPAFIEGSLDDADFNLFYGDGIGIDS